MMEREGSKLFHEFLGCDDSGGDPVFLECLGRNAEQILVSGDQKIRFYLFAQGKIMIILF